MRGPTKSDVLARLRQQEDRLRSLGVKRLGLFGSFAREEQAPGSDHVRAVEAWARRVWAAWEVHHGEVAAFGERHLGLGGA